MKGQIEHLINEFNTGWARGDLESVRALLHDEVIFVAPDLKTQILGRVACLTTIEEYNKNAQTSLFEIKDQNIQQWNTTAVVNIEYYIEYTMNNKTYKERGKEFWTLTKINGTWKIVWRVMLGNEV